MRSTLQLLLVLLFAAILFPQERSIHDKKTLTKLEATWNRAQLTGDAAALERMWADDLPFLHQRIAWRALGD
jgi:hypothetical protein